MSYQAFISGVGTHFPNKIVTNERFYNEKFGLRESWFEDMGVKLRRHAADNESLVSLAVKAAKQALSVSNFQGKDIDVLILTSSTLENNQLVPSEVTEIKHQIGMTEGFCFHQIDGCAGIITAMETASAYVMSGLAKNALVISSDVFSKVANPNLELTWKMSSSASDGAGAIVISRALDSIGKKLGCVLKSSNEFKLGFGIKATSIEVNGQTHAGIYSDKIDSSAKRGFIDSTYVMFQLMRFTSKAVPEAVNAVLKKSNKSLSEIDFFVFHQPNRPFLTKWKNKLGVIDSKTIDTLSEYGNCSATSIVINLETAFKKGLLKKGDIVCLSSVGEGVTYGAALWQWAI